MVKEPLTRRRASKQAARSPLLAPPVQREICLELQDNSFSQQSAIQFFGLRTIYRDAAPAAARLAEQFENHNRSLFQLMDVRFTRNYDGDDVYVSLEAGNVVGAVPLFSPTSGLLDYGLVIQPRFPWPGVGPMLAEMGWRVAPTPLRLPLLKRSERKVPTWVISSMVLARLRTLLDALARRFEVITEVRSAPRGTINWSSYVTRHLAPGQFLSIPCSFPDLQDDRLLAGAIRYALEKQRSALESQREHGAFVHQLIAFCDELLRRVQRCPVFMPPPNMLSAWLQRPLRMQSFRDGLQAIEWTIEDRGLAGISDLEGIPWRMPMEEFFEAWLEVVFHNIAREMGATIKVGRNRETVFPMQWKPSYVGAQNALIPDLWLDCGSTTIIVDAKYKRHWEELEGSSSRSLDETIREQLRQDMFQVLAYANLARKARVIVCLAYPCTPETWQRMCERKRVVHKADISAGTRSVALWLTAVPMATAVNKISRILIPELRTAVA